MPIYEYVCNECREVMEIKQKLDEENPKECPTCGQPGLTRIMSKNVGLSFKGSGFYCNDYPKKD